MSLAVLNFAYGTGPYLRTTELALAFNDELERRGQARMQVIVPWVYGEKQKRIMREEFADHDAAHPGEILLDRELGAILKQIFYGDNSYEQALRVWTATARDVSAEAARHLAGTLTVEDLDGVVYKVRGSEIAVELNRSPRIRYDVAPAYLTTFGYIAEILEGALAAPEGAIGADRILLERGVETARWVEDAQRMRAVAYPATFSGSDAYLARYDDEVLVPPIRSQILVPETQPVSEGIYVTVTGIPGLERLYAEAEALGLKLYANFPDEVPGSERAPIDRIAHPSTVLQFARSGWGSVWLSMLYGTPILVPEYDPTDDPEIYFNNRMVEEFGLGIVYRGEPLAEIIGTRETIQKKYAILREQILTRWGTLDGNEYCAKLFVDDFLANS